MESYITKDGDAQNVKKEKIKEKRSDRLINVLFQFWQPGSTSLILLWSEHSNNFSVGKWCGYMRWSFIEESFLQRYILSTVIVLEWFCTQLSSRKNLHCFFYLINIWSRDQFLKWFSCYNLWSFYQWWEWQNFCWEGVHFFEWKNNSQ